MVKRKARKRKFGSAILMDLESPDDENEGAYADPQTLDEDQMDMNTFYQEDTGMETVDDAIQRIASQNNEADISGSSIDLGNRMHEENVNHAENMSENMQDLISTFHNNTSDGFDLYNHSIAEKIRFTKIVNTKVFEKLKRSRTREIDTMKAKIISIKKIIKDLKDEKKLLKTASFKKNNDDRVERLIMELEIINQELSTTQQKLKKEEEEYNKLNVKLTTLRGRNTQQYSKDSYKKHLENIFKKDTNLKKTKTIVNLSDMSVQEIEENFILKPTSEGLKLHNSVFNKYETDTDYDYNMNVYKRYNLLENLSILKTSSKEKFFKIMGKFKLTEHVDSLDRIDKKHRRIIYDHAISLISSFVPDDRIDELLQNTSLYIKEKYISGFEYTNSNYFPSYQFEDKSYEFTRFTRKGEEKEKKKRNYAPVIGWIYKDNALKDVSNDSNAFKNIIKGKQKFIKGTLEDMRKNPDVNFIEKDSKESKNINVKILIIDKKATVEPWRIRYIKHKLLLDQINERKLYELSRVKNIPFNSLLLLVYTSHVQVYLQVRIKDVQLL